MKTKIVYVPFIDTVINEEQPSRFIKAICEVTFGDINHTMICNHQFKENEALKNYVNEQFELSKDYMFKPYEYPKTGQLFYSFEADDVLLDDHIIVVKDGDELVGVFFSESDFDFVKSKINP